MPLSQLSGAIMAGSLAASRLSPHNTGSSLLPPSLPQRQKSPRLLQTLRHQTTAEDDGDRRKIHRHRLTNKHAHHEGSRKRWRDEITTPQRKRYEAVWASNRGLLLPDDDDPAASVASGVGRVNSECVANVAVRDIWRRSRLPEDELAAVWDLTDRGDAGMLTRQEFVVGMWLVDQLLRGRKLPAKVSDSVWASANGMRAFKPKR